MVFREDWGPSNVANDLVSSFTRLPLSLVDFVPRDQLLADPGVLIAHHFLLIWICPLPWMFDQAYFQSSLCTKSIRLRRY